MVHRTKHLLALVESFRGYHCCGYASRTTAIRKDPRQRCSHQCACSRNSLQQRRHLHSPLTTSSARLIPPELIYSDNHLLVVNKYPGWHTVPNQHSNEKKKNDDDGDKKCLLTYLQKQQLGGGSQRDFLKPLHRIDQPCSGALLLAKTSKAATRITILWKQKLVQKTYFCLIPPERIPHLEQNSSRADVKNNDRDNNDGWFELQGYLQGKTRPDPNNPNPPTGWNVKMSSTAPPKLEGSQTRKLTIHWKSLTDNLLFVKTNQGARHMVRALLSQMGKAPILGDIRYGSTHGALPDQSVALHARSVILPDALKLGTTEQRVFLAPIPPSWNEFGQISEEEVLELLGKSQ